MNRQFQLVLYLVLALSLLSCSNKQNVTETNSLSQDQLSEKLLEANKASIKVENDQMDKLVADSGWEMHETATGLRYQILEKGNGPKTATGNSVQFEYDVKLISGEEIYSSKQSGLKEFVVGNGGVESGLEEGILLLSVGDKVRLIIPSYLAHGLSGDQDRIPPKATLIYTVKLIDLK